MDAFLYGATYTRGRAKPAWNADRDFNDAVLRFHAGDYYVMYGYSTRTEYFMLTLYASRSHTLLYHCCFVIMKSHS